MAVVEERWSDGLSDDESPPAPIPDKPPQHRLTRLLGWYIASRAVVFVAMVIADVRYGIGLHNLFREWDASWYLYIAGHGYPSHPIPMGHWLIQGRGLSSLWAVAFLPGFPLAIAAFGALGIPLVVVGVSISLVCGFIATVGIYRLGAVCFDPEVGRRAAILFCLFPGAFAFSWAYTEGLSLALSVTCVCCLVERRWAGAGVLAGLAGAVHIDIACGLLLACVLAALRAVWSERDLRALVAPALAPTGTLGYLIYLQVWTGSWTNWRRSEQMGWHQKLDFGYREIHAVVLYAHQPMSTSNLIDVIGVVMGVVFLISLWRRRLPMPALVMALTVLAISFASSDVGLRPRAILAASPAFVSLAGILDVRATKLLALGFVAVTPLLIMAYLGPLQLVP